MSYLVLDDELVPAMTECSSRSEQVNRPFRRISSLKLILKALREYGLGK